MPQPTLMCLSTRRSTTKSGTASFACELGVVAQTPRGSIHHDSAESLWLTPVSRRTSPEMSIRSNILMAMEGIAAAQKKTLAPLTDDLALTNSGLDSLCFALLVARLEDETGRDPFSESDEVSFPVTLGEFIALYEHAPA